LYRLLTEAVVRTGELDLAEEFAGRAEEISDRVALPVRMGDARYARACVLLTREHPTQAAVAALEAVDAFDAGKVPVEAARARLIAAQALLTADSTERAQIELERAHQTFTSYGASQAADQAARQLRRLGRRKTPASRRTRAAAPGLQALSEREREVAELAARGDTNRRIAEQLFLSEKTIEIHVSRVLAKLGIRSRAAIAGAIASEHRSH
jgi:DNA-binding NarL/FixJ family response regulator